MTNGSIFAYGNVAIGADSLVASNVVLFAGEALNLTVTNLLTDTGVTNGNNWSIGSIGPQRQPRQLFYQRLQSAHQAANRRFAGNDCYQHGAGPICHQRSHQSQCGHQ